MDVQEVRKSVQPALEQDFDALYEEFVDDTGKTDVRAFLNHLVDFGLVDASVVSPLLGPAPSTGAPSPDAPAPVQPIAWDDHDSEDDEAATILASRADLIKLTEEATLSDSPPVSVVATGPVVEPRAYEDAPTGLGAPQRVAGGRATPALDDLQPLDFREDADDNYTDRRRTHFRRNNGQLEETNAFKRPQRRRTRDDGPELPESPRVDAKRYVFVGNVGEGAMGTVHLVEDHSLKRKIAYKAMSSELASQPTLASKFLAEAQITAQLEHPNIVPVYDLESDKAYTMKLIRGRTVEDLINETRSLLASRKGLDDDHTLEARLDLFLKVCDAMAYSHSRGVVHRDLKPENIMVGEFGEVYVMDWGIAHLMDGDIPDQPEVHGLLDEGELIIGTAGYMSPEQADGRTSELTGASDQYALGLILFELVSLKPAVTGKNQLHIMTRQQLGEVNKLVHATGKKIPAELAAIIGKSIQMEPKDRYPSVDDFADDIRRFLRGDAIIASPDNIWQAFVRFSGRHRQATVLVAMSIIFLSVFFVLLIGVYAWLASTWAEQREQEMSNMVTSAQSHAASIEGQFVRFEGLLLILATTSEDMLTSNTGTDRPYYPTAAFDAGGEPPPDTAMSKVYGVPVSVRSSAFVIPEPPPSTDASGLEPLNRHFRKVMLRSQSEETAQFSPVRASRALTEVGVPLRWAYLATHDGLYDIYPGHGGYPATFDPRQTVWYQSAIQAKGPVWGPPMTDEDLPDGTLVVPVTMALRDINDPTRMLGVAGIDIPFSHLRQNVLLTAAFNHPDVRVRIVDQQGKELFDPSQTAPVPTQMYGQPEVVAEIQARRSGHLENGDTVTIYTRMPTLDWYYVVSGPTETLLTLTRQ